ncbi:unnamed protein product [Leptosia nina]|uniref:Peptidoglycan recognition protein n=1 Tax=Leptosia nina TaxID=320188 RepID=A0AAV1JCG1_9NEOP
MADLNCGVVDIAEWSSKPLSDPVDLVKPVHLVVIQHSATAPCSDDETCKTLLSNVREKHVERLKFKDIGNSFYISSHGKVYEGSGWHVGAHTKGFNDKSIGISFIGDFRDSLPSEEALKAAQDFLSCSVNNESLDENYDLVGHGQLSATLSPGAKLQSLIQSWSHWREKLIQ